MRKLTKTEGKTERNCGIGKEAWGSTAELYLSLSLFDSLRVFTSCV